MINGEVMKKLGMLMDKRVEVQYNTSSELKEISNRLAQQEAEPRDLIAIYHKTLKGKLKEHKDDIEISQMYIEGGRLMLLEMMGYLAQYYRTLALGLSKSIQGATMLSKIKDDLKEEILKELKGE
jgi:hypothetical protein